jgi:hypothetical protein
MAIADKSSCVVHNRKNYIAYLSLVRIGQRQRRQSDFVNLQNSEIAGRIRTNQPRSDRSWPLQINFNLLRTINHMMVREKLAISGNDYS